MKLAQNVGPIDRVARLVIGIGLVALAVGGTVTAPVLFIAWAAAAILLVTGAIGFCPLYLVLGVSTAGNRLVLGRDSRP